MKIKQKPPENQRNAETLEIRGCVSLEVACIFYIGQIEVRCSDSTCFGTVVSPIFTPKDAVEAMWGAKTTC